MLPIRRNKEKCLVQQASGETITWHDACHQMLTWLSTLSLSFVRQDFHHQTHYKLCSNSLERATCCNRCTHWGGFRCNRPEYILVQPIPRGICLERGILWPVTQGCKPPPLYMCTIWKCLRVYRNTAMVTTKSPALYFIIATILTSIAFTWWKILTCAFADMLQLWGVEFQAPHFTYPTSEILGTPMHIA